MLHFSPGAGTSMQGRALCRSSVGFNFNPYGISSLYCRLPPSLAREACILFPAL